MACNYLHLHGFTLFYTCSFIVTFIILIKRAIDEEPLDQMIKLEINKQIGKKQFHGCHLWLNMPKMELLKSSGGGEGHIEKLWSLSSWVIHSYCYMTCECYSNTRFQKILIEKLTYNLTFSTLTPSKALFRELPQFIMEKPHTHMDPILFSPHQ